MVEVAFWRSSKWTYHHVIVFLLTFFGYSLFHATRKAFSNVKTTISEEWTPENLSLPHVYDYKLWNRRDLFNNADDAEVFLGVLDTVFMGAYAVGLYLSGFIGDRFNMRIVLSVGMWLSALTLVMFGTVSEWMHVYNKAWYITFWLLNGLFQSTGWPTTVAIMGNWFGKSSRGLIFGVWGSCTSVGNIVGAYIVAEVLHYGYEYAFLVPAGLMFGGGIVICCSLIPSPKDIGLPEPVDDDPEEQIEEDEPLLSGSEDPEPAFLGKATDANPHEAIGFIQAFCLPGVAAYSFAYACLKMVNYSLFFWLPFYLANNFKWPEAEADRISTWYDVGGIIGAVLSGVITDRMSRRSPTVVAMLAVSPFALYGYSLSPNNKTTNALLMGVTGIFVNGAANIISTAISADLGRQKALKGNSKALATVTGIVDGTGSAGAAIGQIIIPLVQNKVGWNPVFYLFMVMMVMTLVFILPIFIHDVKYYIAKYRGYQPPRVPFDIQEETADEHHKSETDSDDPLS